MRSVRCLARKDTKRGAYCFVRGCCSTRQRATLLSWSIGHRCRVTLPAELGLSLGSPLELPAFLPSLKMFGGWRRLAPTGLVDRDVSQRNEWKRGNGNDRRDLEAVPGEISHRCPVFAARCPRFRGESRRDRGQEATMAEGKSLAPRRKEGFHLGFIRRMRSFR